MRWNVVVIHLELILDDLQDLIPTLVHVVVGALDHQDVLLLLEWPDVEAASRLLSQQGNVVDLLLADGFGVYQIKAIQINILVNIMIGIGLIKDLPGDIIIDLLLHFLELLKCYFFFILFISTLLVFPVNLGLETLTNFLELVNDAQTLVQHILLDFWWALLVGGDTKHGLLLRIIGVG
jgi:hypothetical protein